MNVCPYCGTQIEEGYFVCKGCGAYMARDESKIGLGIFYALVSAGSFYYTEFSTNGIIFGLAFLLAALACFRKRKLKWHRKF